jgi:hypothetical protein
MVFENRIPCAIQITVYRYDLTQIKLNDAIHLYISYLRQGFASGRYLASAYEVPNVGIQS